MKSQILEVLGDLSASWCDRKYELVLQIGVTHTKKGDGPKRIERKIGSTYGVHFIRRDSPYRVHFIRRDSPYRVHFIRRDSP